MVFHHVSRNDNISAPKMVVIKMQELKSRGLGLNVINRMSGLIKGNASVNYQQKQKKVLVLKDAESLNSHLRLDRSLIA